MPPKNIEEVLKEHTSNLLAMNGVVGVGQGLREGKPCIRVYLASTTSELALQLPQNIEGYVVETEVTGEFRALPKKRIPGKSIPNGH